MDDRKKAQMLEELEIKLTYLEEKYDEVEKEKDMMINELSDTMVDQYFVLLDWINNEIDAIVCKMDELKRK